MPTQQRTRTTSKTPTKSFQKKTTKSAKSTKNARAYRQSIAKIDTWSVLKLSLCFHTGAMLTTIVMFSVTWITASSVGIVRNIESFMGTIFEIEDFSFMSFDVLIGVILVGLVFVAILTIISVMASALYNIFAEAVGGVEIYIVEETASSKI